MQYFILKLFGFFSHTLSDQSEFSEGTADPCGNIMRMNFLLQKRQMKVKFKAWQSQKEIKRDRGITASGNNPRKGLSGQLNSHFTLQFHSKDLTQNSLEHSRAPALMWKQFLSNKGGENLPESFVGMPKAGIPATNCKFSFFIGHTPRKQCSTWSETLGYCSAEPPQNQTAEEEELFVFQVKC